MKEEAKKTATALVQAAATGTIGALAGGAELSNIALPAAAGLGFAAILTVGSALFVRDEQAQPYRYLTRVTEAGATLLVTPKRYRAASAKG